MRMKNRSEFATRMRNARRNREMTLSDVGNVIGASVSYVCDVENDKRLPPRSATIIKWAKFIGADPAQAIADSGRPLEVYGSADLIRRVMQELEHGS